MAGFPSDAAPLPLGGADDDDDDSDNSTFFPLIDLLERFPDLFAQKVLAHLDPIDRTFLAQAGSACRAAVAASGLPRAGRWILNVRVVTHKVREFCTSVERLAWATTARGARGRAPGLLGAGTWRC
jgi:hypothetical protein